MMNYIKRAFELADGWSITTDNHGDMNYFYAPMYLPRATIKEMSTLGPRMDKLSQQMLDALAAQLVRQVDALAHVLSHPKNTAVVEHKHFGVLCSVSGNDRTMNTIKAIVDSRVLE